MQTLQTCSFSKRSLEESSRETLNKSSNQRRVSFLPSISGPVSFCCLSTHTNIFIPLTAFLFLRVCQTCLPSALPHLTFILFTFFSCLFLSYSVYCHHLPPPLLFLWLSIQYICNNCFYSFLFVSHISFFTQGSHSRTF